jgi:hypothetical protein
MEGVNRPKFHRLFNLLLLNPKNTRPALEIEILDDNELGIAIPTN